MDDALKKHVSVFSTMFICLCYCYYISTRIPKGLLRLISILPILFIFTTLPLHLPPIFFSIMTISLLLLLANCKLILLTFGKGPLSPAQTLFSFIASGALPIQNPSSKQPSKPRTKPLGLVIEFLAFAIVIGVISEHRQNLHEKILQQFYGCFVFLYLDLFWTSSKFVLRALFGMEIETMFDEPYLSTSLHEYWGRRWNLMTANMLGQVVYKPVRSVSAVVLGHDLASVPAHLATFLVSGLFHELMLYCLTRENPSWEMTACFVVNGIGMALESRVKKAVKGRMRLPRFMSVLWTYGFMNFASLWFFYPPVVRGGVDNLVIAEFRSLRLFFQNGITY